MNLSFNFNNLRENNYFPIITTTFSIFSVAIIAVTLLFLGVFIAHSGNFTRFINCLSFVFFIYYLWLESSGILRHTDSANTLGSLELGQEDSLYFRFFLVYTTITLIVFFAGIADRFFLSKRSMFEFPLLVLFLHFGGIFALRLHTFRDIFLALEIVTLASYVIVTFERQNRFSTYAGVQYFILGSLPSAIILIAFGLFYLQGGSVALQDLDLVFNSVTNTISITEATDLSAFHDYLNLSKITENESLTPSTWYLSSDSVWLDFFNMQTIQSAIETTNPVNSLTIRAISFLLFNFLFKLTAAPFHVWAPSVYGKAPIVSVAFLSIYSKVRIFFLLFKLRNSFLHVFSFILLFRLLFVGVLSIAVGRVGAFSEKTIKRFFVYSSRGHVGFMLVGLSLNTIDGYVATFHYLAVYVLTSFVMWFILLTRGRQTTKLSQFSELKNRNPTLALVFAFLIFSRSGIPPLGGFFIKLDILSALRNSSHFFTTYVLFFFTVAGFFYYLRLIKIRYFDVSNNSQTSLPISFSTTYAYEYSFNNYRNWIISIIIIILSCYRFIIQKPLLVIEIEILASLF